MQPWNGSGSLLPRPPGYNSEEGKQHMKKRTYMTFTGLADLLDFKDSGHEVDRRLEAGVSITARR